MSTRRCGGRDITDPTPVERARTQTTATTRPVVDGARSDAEQSGDLFDGQERRGAVALLLRQLVTLSDVVLDGLNRDSNSNSDDESLTEIPEALAGVALPEVETAPSSTPSPKAAGHPAPVARLMTEAAAAPTVGINAAGIEYETSAGPPDPGLSGSLPRIAMCRENAKAATVATKDTPS